MARAHTSITITLSVLKKPQPHRNDDQTPGVIIVTVHVFTSAWLFTPIHNFIVTQRYHLQTGCYVDHQVLHIFALRRIFFSGAIVPSGSAPHYRGFNITLRHATFGRTLLDGWSARRRDLYLPTHNTHKRETAMPPAGFIPTIPTSERPQTHALDRAATGIGLRRKY